MLSVGFCIRSRSNLFPAGPVCSKPKNVNSVAVRILGSSFFERPKHPNWLERCLRCFGRLYRRLGIISGPANATIPACSIVAMGASLADCSVSLDALRRQEQAAPVLSAKISFKLFVNIIVQFK